MSVTTKIRAILIALFVISVLSTLAGWAFYDRDPSKLDGLLQFLAIAVGIGEASNVGKRFTWKKEAVEADAEG